MQHIEAHEDHGNTEISEVHDLQLATIRCLCVCAFEPQPLSWGRVVFDLASKGAHEELLDVYHNLHVSKFIFAPVNLKCAGMCCIACKSARALGNMCF